MKRLVVGLLIGMAIGTSWAIAGVRDIIIRPGDSATVTTIRKFGTRVTFAAIDLRCTYAIPKIAINQDPAGAPTLFCRRKSSPGPTNPNAVQSRMVIVTKLHYYVTNNHEQVVYRVNRAP